MHIVIILFVAAVWSLVKKKWWSVKDGNSWWVFCAVRFLFCFPFLFVCNAFFFITVLRIKGKQIFFFLCSFELFFVCCCCFWTYLHYWPCFLGLRCNYSILDSTSNKSTSSNSVCKPVVYKPLFFFPLNLLFNHTYLLFCALRLQIWWEFFSVSSNWWRVGSCCEVKEYLH